VLLTEVCDVGAGGFEDPQSQQTQHRNQGEVVAVGRLSGGGQHRLELQMRQPQRR